MADIRINLEIDTEWMDKIEDTKDWSQEDIAEYIQDQIMELLPFAQMVFVNKDDYSKLHLSDLT